MRVLISPDKFKGTLSATQAARAIALGWRRVRPGDEVALLPMSDGGDGFGEVLGSALDARVFTVNTIDAAHRPRRARWWWVADQRLAILESAQTIGLAVLPRGRFHPFQLDTAGLAPLVRAVVACEAVRCLIGVGGSATNDGGFGLARAMGWRFLDRHGTPLERWTELTRLAQLAPPESADEAQPTRPSRAPPHCEFIVATDVNNPLLGARGATRVYGPQKGLSLAELPAAEACLKRLGRIARERLGVDPREPGSGAAGGLGFGLCAFLGAQRRLGFEVFAEQTNLEAHLRRADLVVTGEGAFDRQSMMGKGVGQLLARARRAGKPCAVLAGVLELPGSAARRLWFAGALVGLTTADQALTQPVRWLERLAEACARRW